MSDPKHPDGQRDGEGGEGESFGRRQYDRVRARERASALGRRDYDQPQDADDGDDRERADDPGAHERGNGNGGRAPERRDSREDDHDRRDAPPESAQGRERRSFHAVGLVLVIIICVAAVGTGILYWRHHRRLSRDKEQRQDVVDRGPRIFVTEVKLQPAARDLTLPADVRGFFQATLYAKVSGYVKSIVVDKGDPVRQGQLIGVLESPEVDQQVAAAEADLVIKRRTFERYQKLVAKDFVSAQDYETARAQYGVSEAQLRQMRALQAYKTLRAPFAGTVTARYVDPGALVPAATGSTQSALPMVDIADLRRLRITVFVQQDAAPFLHVGDPVTIAVDERPDLKIKATISRFAKSLDTRSRMMLCEVWVDNTQHLYPGTFVHMTLTLQGPRVPQVPSSALLLHNNHPAVATVRDGKVHFVQVQPGIDDGHIVQILEGLKEGERVALNLPAEVADGATVQPVEQPQKHPEGARANEAGGGDKKQPPLAATAGQGGGKSGKSGDKSGKSGGKSGKGQEGAGGASSGSGAGDKAGGGKSGPASGDESGQPGGQAGPTTGSANPNAGQ